MSYYTESISLNYSECSGYSIGGPSYMTFGSYEIGKLKGFFSQYEKFDDSEVSVSIRPGFYDLTITVNSNLTRGDSWCSSVLNDAMNYVKNHVINSCQQGSGRLNITIELYTL